MVDNNIAILKVGLAIATTTKSLEKKDVIIKSSFGVLLVAVLVNGLMFRSGWLGGKIKHDEIRGTVASAPASENNTETGGAESEQEKDDD